MKGYKDRVYTSLNIGQDLYDKVVDLSGTTGDSINGTFITLVALGLKIMQASQLSIITDEANNGASTK